MFIITFALLTFTTQCYKSATIWSEVRVLHPDPTLPQPLHWRHPHQLTLLLLSQDPKHGHPNRVILFGVLAIVSAAQLIFFSAA